MKLLKIKLDALEQEILSKGLENFKNDWIDEIKAMESNGKIPLFSKEFVENKIKEISEKLKLNENSIIQSIIAEQ